MVVQLVFLVVEEMEDLVVVDLVVYLVQQVSKEMVIHPLQLLHKDQMVVVVVVHLDLAVAAVVQLLLVEDQQVLLMVEQVVLEQQVQSIELQLLEQAEAEAVVPLVVVLQGELAVVDQVVLLIQQELQEQQILAVEVVEQVSVQLLQAILQVVLVVQV